MRRWLCRQRRFARGGVLILTAQRRLIALIRSNWDRCYGRQSCFGIALVIDGRPQAVVPVPDSMNGFTAVRAGVSARRAAVALFGLQVF